MRKSLRIGPGSPGVQNLVQRHKSLIRPAFDDFTTCGDPSFRCAFSSVSDFLSRLAFHIHGIQHGVQTVFKERKVEKSQSNRRLRNKPLGRAPYIDTTTSTRTLPTTSFCKAFTATRCSIHGHSCNYVFCWRIFRRAVVLEESDLASGLLRPQLTE